MRHGGAVETTREADLSEESEKSEKGKEGEDNERVEEK